MTQNVTPLQLGALLHSGICITPNTNNPVPVSVKAREPLPRRETLCLFPIGFTT